MIPDAQDVLLAASRSRPAWGPARREIGAKKTGCFGSLVRDESAREGFSSSVVASSSSSTEGPCLHTTIVSMFLPMAEQEDTAAGNAIDSTVVAVVENSGSVCDEMLVGKMKSFIGFSWHWREKPAVVVSMEPLSKPGAC